LDWGNLSRIKASQEQLSREQHVLSWYEWLFSQGTLRWAAARIGKFAQQRMYAVNGKIVVKVETEGSFRKTKFGSKQRFAWKPLSLSTLVGWLVDANIVPYNFRRSQG